MPCCASHWRKMSVGVRTQMAELMTVVPPTVRACTTGHSARPIVTCEPKSSVRSLSEP